MLTKLCLALNTLFLPRELTDYWEKSRESEGAASLHGNSYQNTSFLLSFSYIRLPTS